MVRPPDGEEGSPRRAADPRDRGGSEVVQPGSASTSGRGEQLTLVGADLQQRHTRRGKSGRQRPQQATDEVQPVGTAVEREARLEAGRHRQVRHGRAGDVGQVGEQQVDGDRGRRVDREQIAGREVDDVGHAVANGVLDRQSKRVSRDVRGEDPEVPAVTTAPERDRQGDRDGPGAGAHVPDPQRRGVRGPGRADQTSRTRSTASSTSRSVSGRGISARESTVKTRP